MLKQSWLRQSLLAVALGTGSACPRAQDPGVGSAVQFATLSNGLRYACIEVPGARGLCAVLAVAAGADHDPPGQTGLGAVVAELLRLVHEAERVADRVQVELLGPVTLLSVVRTDGEAADVLAPWERVLGGRLEIDADRATRALWRAALRADDATQVFPGPILRGTAQRALLAGTPAGRQAVGILAEMRAIDAGVLRSRCAAQFRPRHAWLVVAGGLPAAELDRAVQERLGSLPGGEAPAAAARSHDRLPAPVVQAAHDRLNAPYVALALAAPAPASPSFASFLVAMEVLRGRATHDLRPARSGEASAGVTPFEYDAARLPLVTINRRARDGGSMDEVREELAAFAARACGRVVAQDLELAASRLRWQLRPPPWDGALAAALRDPRSLHPRVRRLVLAAILGWPTDLHEQVAAVSADQVTELLRVALAPAQHRFFALVPPGLASPGR